MIGLINNLKFSVIPGIPPTYYWTTDETFVFIKIT